MAVGWADTMVRLGLCPSMDVRLVRREALAACGAAAAPSTVTTPACFPRWRRLEGREG